MRFRCEASGASTFAKTRTFDFFTVFRDTAGNKGGRRRTFRKLGVNCI